MSNIEEAPTSGKGRATPKRTDARAARASERKAAPPDRKERSAARRKSMQEAREAMNQTDVSKLPATERVPELVYVRDLVDSRFYVGQALVWVMAAVVVLGLIPSLQGISSFGGMAALLVIVAITIYDCRRIAALVQERFPDSPVRVRFYAARRLFAPRRLRKPVPRVSRGAMIR